MEKKYHSQSGSAKIKLLIFLVIVGLAGYAGMNYVPIAYNDMSLKQEMQTAVIQGFAVPTYGKSQADSIKDRLLVLSKTFDFPPTAISITNQANSVSARVWFTRQISLMPFGLYNYTYTFDNTSTPSGFLTR